MLDNGNGFWSIFFALIILILVLVLAYFATKWLGKRTGVGGTKGNIEILDRQYVGQDKCLMIVRVGNHSMLLGVTSNQITKISEVDESELQPTRNVTQPDFASVIRKTLDKMHPWNAQETPRNSTESPRNSQEIPLNSDDDKGGLST